MMRKKTKEESWGLNLKSQRRRKPLMVSLWMLFSEHSVKTMNHVTFQSWRCRPVRKLKADSLRFRLQSPFTVICWDLGPSTPPPSLGFCSLLHFKETASFSRLLWCRTQLKCQSGERLDKVNGWRFIHWTDGRRAAWILLVFFCLFPAGELREIQNVLQLTEKRTSCVTLTRLNQPHTMIMSPPCFIVGF